MPTTSQNACTPVLAIALLAGLIASCTKRQATDPEMNNEEEQTKLDVPADVTPAVFKQWRNARRGTAHAEPQNNPYWSWLVGGEASSWSANEHFKGPSSYGGDPAWSADRFGQSTTELADGRKILIAGEHEDFYDPDFFIYNDVAVVHPGGGIDFYGYPETEFPPTDFHSATQLGDQIILIGNLGYPADRKPGTTPILVLELDTWKISKQDSNGENPGWIHRHDATLAEDGKSILITGGLLLPPDPESPIIENIDDWRLHLSDWRWERLTQRNWPLFEIARGDDEWIKLSEMRHAIWNLKYKHPKLYANYEAKGKNLKATDFAALEKLTGSPLPKDPKVLESLFRPEGIEHKVIPENEDDEYGTQRIEIDGVIVRYVENSYHILVTIEGELPKQTSDAIIADLTRKLASIEEVEYASKQIRP